MIPFPSRTRFVPAAVATASILLLMAAVPAVGQEDEASEDAAERITITGQVLDANTGAPIPTTVVRMIKPERSVMTDADGRFSMTYVPTGTRRLVFDQLGYTRITVTQEFAPDAAPVVVELAPQPVVLEGLEVMVDRFDARRQSAGVAVRVLRAEDFRAQPVDLFRAIRTRAGLALTECSSPTRMTTLCVFSRGSYAPPNVWVDDRPSMGIEELELYRTDDVYAVEVYQSGRHIRVYTRQYMQSVAMSPRAVRPVWGW